MRALRIIAVGTSSGVMLPKKMPSRLKVKKGDTLYAVETAEGYLLTRNEPTIEEQSRVGQAFMKEHRDTFKALAK